MLFRSLSCSYCFAKELVSEFPKDLDPERFERLLEWMRGASLPAVAFIGGEPTLHPNLPEMIERTAGAGLSTVLFTNGIFPEELVDRLAPVVSNFVVNYNDPSMYSKAQSEQLHQNLSRLHALGARVTFSKNFSNEYCEYEYLLEGAEKYGVNTVQIGRASCRERVT